MKPQENPKPSLHVKASAAAASCSPERRWRLRGSRARSRRRNPRRRPPRRPAVRSPTSKPNVLVIFGDDIGVTNLSAYSQGLMGYETPNIDRVAREGLKFLHYY